MIGGKTGGVLVTVTFGPFSCVPQKAWEGCRRAMQAALEMYGIDATVTTEGEQDDAFRRWFKWRDTQAYEPAE